MFLDLPLPRSAYVRADFIQATEAGLMAELFRKKLAAIVAENDSRVKQNAVPLSVADVGIAASGDSFVVHFLLVGGAIAGGRAGRAEELGSVRAEFWMANDAESLDDYQEAAVTAALGATGLSTPAFGIAGGKGRFMGFLAGVPITGT